MKICILFDNHFPYSSGESFLETEIPFLENAFDKIIIVVCTNSDFTITRSYNKNKVEIVKIEISNSKLNKVLSIITGLFLCRTKERRLIKNLHIKKKIISYYFEGNSLRRYNRIKNELDDKIRNLTADTEIVIYSYWFSLPAIIASYAYEKYVKDFKNIRFISRGHGYDIYSERQRSGFLSHWKG